MREKTLTDQMTAGQKKSQEGRVKQSEKDGMRKREREHFERCIIRTETSLS